MSLKRREELHCLAGSVVYLRQFVSSSLAGRVSNFSIFFCDEINEIISIHPTTTQCPDSKNTCRRRPTMRSSHESYRTSGKMRNKAEHMQDTLKTPCPPRHPRLVHDRQQQLLKMRNWQGGFRRSGITTKDSKETGRQRTTQSQHNRPSRSRLLLHPKSLHKCQAPSQTFSTPATRRGSWRT